MPSATRSTSHRLFKVYYQKFDFLGFTFKPRMVKERGKFRMGFTPAISQKNIARITDGLRKLKIHRWVYFPLSRIAELLKSKIRGWINYFKFASIYNKLNVLDGWLRNRIRYCIWTDWKKPERKRKNLIRLGVDPDHAYQWSRSRKGGWAVAQSPILVTGVSINRIGDYQYVKDTI